MGLFRKDDDFKRAQLFAAGVFFAAVVLAVDFDAVARERVAGFLAAAGFAAVLVAGLAADFAALAVSGLSMM